MKRGNNYSGPRWIFRARPSKTTGSPDEGPRCPECGSLILRRNGVTKCATLPGQRCARQGGDAP